MDAPIEQLKLLFRQGSVSRSAGLHGEKMLYFEGELEQHAEGADGLRRLLGPQADPLLMEFLAVFGGTHLFVNSYGLGTRVYTFREIINNIALLNKEPETDILAADIIIIGEDAVGDMLCLYRDENNEWHFGNLCHECGWDDKEEWLEGFTPARFSSWLTCFIETRGITLPDKTCAYTIIATIEYILPQKAHLHLKLGRKLAVFVKAGAWFESKTFEWIRIEGKLAPYTATYVKTYDEGNEYTTDVLSFRTAAYNDADRAENSVSGSLEDCMRWMDERLEGASIRLMRQEDLRIIYLNMVKKKLLGL